jgi:hypothetical protein
MATEVLDGNQAATQAPATVDAQAFAQAMARELAVTLKQTASPAQKADEIGEVISALKARGMEDSDIEAHISTALGVTKKAERETDEKIKAATGQFLQYQTEKELTTAVRRITKSYTKDDDLLSEVSGTIRDHIKNEFMNGSTAEIVTARNLFLNKGELDEDVLDDIASRKIDKIEKARAGKKTAATPTLSNSDTPSRPGAEADTSKVSDPREGLMEVQRSIYDATLSQFKRTMKPEEAQKQALIAAQRIKK